MTTAFSANALLSFYAWLDHRLLQQGQMYTNTTSVLTPQQDGVLGNRVSTYAAPFRSLVWDSSISGASQFSSISGSMFNSARYRSSGSGQLYSSVVFPQIPSTGYGSAPLQFDLSFPSYISVPTGVAYLSGNSVYFTDTLTQTGVVRLSGANSGTYSDLTFTITGQPTVILRGQYGMQMDYQNGRAILPAGTIPSYAVVSGSYAIKDFNVYFGNQLAEYMRFTDKPYLNSRFARATTPPAPYEMTTPAIFISDSRIANTLKGLGGPYETTIQVRADIMAENLGQLENAMSLLRDSKDLCFPQITTAQWPLAPTGDLKAAPYNYETLSNSLYTPDNLFTISRVRCYKGSDSDAVDQSIFLGRAEFTLLRQRRIG